MNLRLNVLGCRADILGTRHSAQCVHLPFMGPNK